MCEMVCQIFQKKQEGKRIEEEQAANARYWKIPACCDDDDDYDSAITPVLSTEETENSLSMGDDHLHTILATESDEVIKSSVEDLVPVPSESEGENGCDEKIFLNPLFEEEIISIKKNQHHFNAESDLVESMLNRDSSIISSSSKIDSLLDEFAGELTLLKSIPPGIDKTECHPENEICLSQRFDSFMEEIDLFLTPDDPMPPSIEDDDNDFEGDNLFLERLLHDDHIPLPDTLDFSNVVRVFLPFFTHSGMKIPSLTQASPLIIFIRFSLVYLIGVELSRNSILTVVT
nr:hypothetical protein [Tanacetum cinerariifolium]